MSKKNKTLGLIISGVALLSVNSPVVNAEENQSQTDDNSIKEETKSSSSLSTESQKKNLPVEVENKTATNVSFDGKYDTLEEAEKRKTEKEEEYKNDGYEDIKSEIKTIKDTTGHQEFDKFVVEITTDAYTDLSKEEADEIKTELEKDENVTAVIKEAGEITETETSDFSEDFENQEDADAILKALEDEGYTLSDVTYVYDKGSEEVTLSETFDTEDEANAAIKDFEDKYTTTSSGVSKVENSSKDQTEEYSQDFDNEADADTYKTNEEAKNTSDIVYTATKEEKATETESLNESFETREEAEAAISEFESTHSVLDSESNIEEKEVGTIYNALVITKDMKTYEVGSSTYIIIKHGNEHVIWTEKELTEEEQNTFIESYKEHEDNVITYRKLKQKHKFTSGYGESNYSGNGKLFTFYEEDGKTYIKMASGAESRVIAGEFQSINEYVATASGHNITYTINVTKLTKGYDYVAEATGTKEVTLESGTVSGKKTKSTTKKVYSIDVSTQKETYKTVYDDDYELLINGVKKDKEVSEIVNNPQTSDNISYSFIAMFASSIGLALTSLKNKLTRKEN